MACDPNALLEAAKCFLCKYSSISQLYAAVEIRMLCAIRDGETLACDPDSLAHEARCIMHCIPPGAMQAVKIKILCDIVGQTAGSVEPCDPNQLLEDATCFQCKLDALGPIYDAAEIRLLCGIRDEENIPCEPDFIMNEARCILHCIPPGAMQAVKLGILCDILDEETDELAPSLWWTYEDVNSMVDEVEGIAMTVLIPTQGTGIVGGGMEFIVSPNTSQFLMTGDIPQIPWTAGQHFSMSSWFRNLGAFDANDQFLLHEYQDDGVNNDISVRLDESGGGVNIILEVENGTDGDQVSAAYTLDTDWHHIVTVYDGDTGIATTYIDTVQVLQTTIPVMLITAAIGRVQIVQLGSAGGPASATIVDEFGVFFDHKLTTAEIDFLYNGGAGRTYPF